MLTHSSVYHKVCSKGAHAKVGVGKLTLSRPLIGQLSPFLSSHWLQLSARPPLCKGDCLNKKCSCVRDEQRKRCTKVTCKCKCFDTRQTVDEEKMEVGDIDSEDDWDMEVLSEIEEAELDDNVSVSSINSDREISDEEFIPFRFDIDNINDFSD